MKRDQVMDFFRLLPSGFSFTTTITLAMLTNDFNVTYIPVDYYKRTGQSRKINPIKDTANFFSLVVRMILCLLAAGVCAGSGCCFSSRW